MVREGRIRLTISKTIWQNLLKFKAITCGGEIELRKLGQNLEPQITPIKMDQ
jgi:hypothetical protein